MSHMHVARLLARPFSCSGPVQNLMKSRAAPIDLSRSSVGQLNLFEAAVISSSDRQKRSSPNKDLPCVTAVTQQLQELKSLPLTPLD